MTLPSNVQSSKNNTLSNYETILRTTLLLDGDWKVGLSEIPFTNSWFNVKKEDSRITVFDPVANRVLDKVFVRPGRYDTVESLFEEIRMSWLLKPDRKYPWLSYSVNHRQVTAHAGKTAEGNPLYMTMSGGVAQLLGFRDMGRKNRISELEPASEPYDLTGGLYSIYVYCDVCEHSLVGDKCVQLLRSVKIPPKSQAGEMIDICFDNPHYIPVSKREISRIEISLKDDAGEDIDFKYGRTEVTLHFVRES